MREVGSNLAWVLVSAFVAMALTATCSVRPIFESRVLTECLRAGHSPETCQEL